MVYNNKCSNVNFAIVKEDYMIIKIARVKKDLTLERLAQEIGVNKNTIVKYEKGDYGAMKLKTFKKLIEVLDLTPEESLELIQRIEN